MAAFLLVVLAHGTANKDPEDLNWMRSNGTIPIDIQDAIRNAEMRKVT
jgi:hypothetical protein